MCAESLTPRKTELGWIIDMPAEMAAILLNGIELHTTVTNTVESELNNALLRRNAYGVQ